MPLKCFKCLEKIENEQPLHGLHQPCFREWFGLKEIQEFSEVKIKNSGSSATTKAEKHAFSSFNSSYFHGKFKKYSAVLGDHAYILKVRDEKYPELPATEYLSNQVARYLRLNVADFYYIKFDNKTDTFVTRNFMQDLATSNLVHIYHFIPEGGSYDCENLIKAIEAKTQRLSDIERFIELCLFDSLIGNNDRHGRNMALIQTKKAIAGVSPEGFELSPFYDNPTYVGVEEDLLGADLVPAGYIWTSKSKEPSMKDYVEDFIRLDRKSVLVKFLDKINVEHIISMIDNAFISEQRKVAFKRLFEKRYKELKDGVC